MPQRIHHSPEGQTRGADRKRSKSAGRAAHDVHRLQGHIGNRGVGRLLERPRLGAPGDGAEARADDAADRVTRRLAGHSLAPPPRAADPARDTIRRAGAGGAGGGRISASQAAELGRARRGGRRLSGPTRSALERGFGRSLPDMTLHTGPAADSLTRAFRSRAFSVDDHIFLGRSVGPLDSPGGRAVLAHEVAHGLEREPGVIRRLYHDTGLNKWFSHALTGQHVDASNAVVTVVGESRKIKKGHTWIYLEYMGGKGRDFPVTEKVELTAGGGTFSGSGGSGPSKSSVASSAESQGMSSGSSGSGSGSRSRIHITHEAAKTKEKDLLATKSTKRSWVVGRDAIDRIIAKAHAVRDTADEYTYKLTGRSLFALKKTVNCARFGEKILKAGGISVSAGWMMKTTAGLLDGDSVGYTKDEDYARREDAEIEARRLADEQARQLQERFDRVPNGKLRATFKSSARELLVQPESKSVDMMPYELVDSVDGPLQIDKRAAFVVTEHTKGQGIALARGEMSDHENMRRTAAHADLADLVTKTDALSPRETVDL